MYCNLNNRTYFTQLACCRISFIKKKGGFKIFILTRQTNTGFANVRKPNLLAYSLV